MKIFLDNKSVNIYDPVSRQTLIRGIYKFPFWIIKLKIKKENASLNQVEIIVFVGESTEEHKYNTRSKRLSNNSEIMCRESNNSTIVASNKNDMDKKNDTEITGTVGNENSKNESGSEIKNNNNKLIKNLLGRKIHNLNENLDENELNEIVDITYEH